MFFLLVSEGSLSYARCQGLDRASRLESLPTTGAPQDPKLKILSPRSAKILQPD